MVAAFAAAGTLGSGIDLTPVGGVEVMSRPPIGLTSEASKRLIDLFGRDPTAALAGLKALEPQDYIVQIKGWANRITGRTMGDRARISWPRIGTSMPKSRSTASAKACSWFIGAT